MAKTYKIACLPGDGTGPEVIAEGVKVLKAAAKKFGFSMKFDTFDWGGTRYVEQGSIMPDDATEILKKYNAIYLGAIGRPDVAPGILEKGILLKLRFDLDQYINLRPVKLYPGVETPLANKTPEDIDYVVVRENSGDVYTGMGGVARKGTADEVAIQEMVYTRTQVDRCLKFAFELAKKRHSKKNPWRGLSEEDKAFAKFADEFEDRYVRQGEYDNRTIEDTLQLGWELLTIVPVRELKRVRDEYIEKYLKPLVEAKEELAHQEQ